MPKVAPASEMFAPEVILPTQFFTPRSAEQPERRLMLAVLEDAVLTLCKHVGDRRAGARRLVREVEQWMEACNRDWLFSFENVCANLNFSPSAVRRRLRRMLDEGVEAARAHVLPFSIGRRVAGERHRVSAPRRHRRTSPVADQTNAAVRSSGTPARTA
jgi:hypothetical protein